METCCSRWYAKCAVGSDSGIDMLREPWERLASNGLIPNVDSETKYKVYSFRSDKLGAHMSLVFTHDDTTFISVSLCIVKQNETPVTALSSKLLDKDVAFKLKLHGELNTNAQTIIDILTRTLDHFGVFNKLTNNCQDFSKAALKNFGLSEVPIGDREAVLITGGAVTILAGVAAAGFAILRAILKQD